MATFHTLKGAENKNPSTLLGLPNCKVFCFVNGREKSPPKF
jgi:hypothetical protein